MAVLAVTVVSMILGLLISAMIGNADRGMPLLVLVVIASQLVLCAGMFGVKDRIPLEQLAWLSPSRWAYAMAASTVDLNDMHRTAADQDPMLELRPPSLVVRCGRVCRPGARAGDPDRAAAAPNRSSATPS